VREEGDIETGSNAFVVAEQQKVLNLRELGGVDGNNELVDHLAFEEGRKFAPKVNRIGPANIDFAWLVGKESDQGEALSAGLADGPGNSLRARTIAANQDLAGLGQAAGECRRYGAKQEPENKQGDEGEGEEEAKKWATEVQAQKELEQDDGDA